MMNKRRFSADFETCTWIENETYVWCWATCEIGAEYVTEWGTDIDSFFKWCEIQGNIDIYFHNLKFDGEFIINYLLSNNFRCVNTKEQRKEKKKQILHIQFLLDNIFQKLYMDLHKDRDPSLQNL